MRLEIGAQLVCAGEMNGLPSGFLRALDIDDGARKAGWQAVHFTGADKLRADLRAHGVEI